MAVAHRLQRAGRRAGARGRGSGRVRACDRGKMRLSCRHASAPVEARPHHTRHKRCQERSEPPNPTSSSPPSAAPPPAHLVHAVEVLHVLLVHIAGGDVGAAAKPPLARHALVVKHLKQPAARRGRGRQQPQVQRPCLCRKAKPVRGLTRRKLQLRLAARQLQLGAAAVPGAKPSAQCLARHQAARPPARRAPVVEVHGGAVRVPGVHDARDARHKEGHAVVRVHGHVLANGRAVRVAGHGAVHGRHRNAGLLPHLALLQGRAGGGAGGAGEEGEQVLGPRVGAALRVLWRAAQCRRLPACSSWSTPHQPPQPGPPCPPAPGPAPPQPPTPAALPSANLQQPATAAALARTCITAVTPPPPPARVHSSRRNFWPLPSMSSTAAQIEFWALRIILWKRARTLQGGGGGVAGTG